MNPTMVTEKELRPISGYLAMFAWIFGLLVSTASFIFGCIGLALEFYLIGSILMVLSLIGWTLFSVLLGGLKVVHPVEARIFTLFGNYYGTIKQPGFFFINPFCISFSPDFAAARATAAANIRTRGTNATPPLVTAQQISLMSRAISLKTQTLDNGLQKVNDVLGNPIIIGAIVIWRVSNPTQAVFAVENYRGYLASQTDSTIRNVARLYPYDNFSE
ncbi:MAG: SPFH domain-containing protein, partial [Actinomycetia bacterium]|nr:SPFH domain-containing protein [Actinomycetes bacterium]